MVSRLAITRLTTRSRVFRGREYSAMSRSLAPVRGDQHPLEDLELLQAFARADRHAGQRILGYVDRHAGLVLQTLVHTFEESAAPGENDPLVQEVGGQLERATIKRVLVVTE